ncbi:MAG: hypothetical protein LBP27_06795, partial [Treponema sp.]|nr:hypothetical protein [Treponema sp.]
MKTLKKISLLFLPVLFLSCDLLFNKPDGDLMKDIEDSVWESNAPRLQVTMYYIDGAGTTNPAKGLVMPQPKQRIEFSVSFAANPEYGFVEWRAFYTGNRPENEQDWQEAAASLAGIVRFGSPRDLSTTVLVDSNSAHITLEPFCLRRPEVIRSDPMWTGSSSRFFTNQPIRIWFDMSIDPASVNDFNNISITGVTYQGTGTMVDLVKDRYFKPPALEEKGTMLLIKPDMDAFSEGILPNSDISIRLDINIRHDAFTEIDGGAGLRMTRPLTITYGTTGGPDKSVPQVLHVRGAQSEEDTVLFGKNDADPYTLHYRQNKAELYLLFNAYKPTETPIYDVTIYELPESAAEGTAYEVEELFWKAGGSLETLYSKVYESEYLEPPLTGTGRTKVKYRIRSETAGRVNLYILPEDMLGNKVTVADAKTQNFVMPVIIDPPPAPVTITQASYNRAEGGFELRWNPPAEPATPEGTVALEIEWKKNGNDITIPGSAIPADDPRFAAGIWNVPYISGDNEDQYTITVRALDGYENYSLSEPLTLRADTKPPAAATNLNVAHDRGARTITVTWADPAVPDLEYLRLSWATRDGSSTGEAKVPKGAKAYTLGNISNDSVYEFTLTAIDESGNESTPAVTGVNTGGGPVYVPPVSGLSAVYDAAARTITASWTNPNSSAFTGLSLAWNNGAGISGSADPGKAGSWTINGIANNSGVYTL